MKKFVGATGVIVKELPREWKDLFKTGRFRVQFDDPTLIYPASDGTHHNLLNFFPNEIEVI